MSALHVGTAASKVTDLLQFARDARAQCNVSQSKFTVALQALDALCSELEYYNSVTQKPIDSGTRQVLEKHLTPCRNSLNSIVTIRQKYRVEMSIGERAKWKATDGEKFNKAVSGLLEATNLLRSTIRMVEQKISSQTGPKSVNSNRVVKIPSEGMQSESGSHHPTATECRNGSGCRVFECKFTHPYASPCRHGASCINTNCAFKHPQTPLCRNGAGCKTPGCTFTHPKAEECRYGANCTVSNCSYKHPRTSLCHRGASCKVLNCRYSHPEAENCWYGVACERENCKFAHPQPANTKRPKEPKPKEFRKPKQQRSK